MAANEDRSVEWWARGVRKALQTEFPSAAGHVALGVDDCDVSPRRLHPAFWGCLDWHSSVHMQWSALRLLTAHAEQIESATRQALSYLLTERLTPANVDAEVAYLTAHPGFERPYGWGWAALLAASAATVDDPDARRWADALAPLGDLILRRTLDWLPTQVYPVRSGVHDNSAFALGLLHDAAVALGRRDVTDAIGVRSWEWYGLDRDYPAAWEPSGHDFLSAALCEADLMRRLLPASDFCAWLGAFLPDLAAEADPLLGVPQVRDASDGKLVHLFGLALSKAAQLHRLAPFLDADRAARARAAASELVAFAEPQIVDGDFMSTHWLVSFALLADAAA